jgi:hypothetical protein
MEKGDEGEVRAKGMEDQEAIGSAVMGAAGGAAARAPIVASISNNIGGGDARLGGGNGGHVGGGGRSTQLGGLSGWHVGDGARHTTGRRRHGRAAGRKQRPVRGIGEGIRQQHHAWVLPSRVVTWRWRLPATGSPGGF